MTQSDLERLVKNGDECIIYLEKLAAHADDPVEHNTILNHALAVASLIGAFRSLYISCKQDEIRLNKATDKLREFERGLYGAYISEKLDILKQSLICHINEFESD